MNEIVGYIILGIMGLVGGLPALYLVVSFPAVIIWKLFRKIRFGYKMTD